MMKKGVDEIMIDIVMDKDRNLKNLKQIGTPKEDDKIYIENFAYAKIKENSYKEKRVFVLMGHTERMEGRYATFVEAIIPVKEIDFSGGVPRWNNSTWSEVFREIKRLYEDMIIVGWAIDIKGMLPRMTPELERVHREHFGGVHQLLFLLDTLEQEETFYMYKENKVIAKDGFYIYHRARKKEDVEQIPITVLPEREKQRSNEREKASGDYVLKEKEVALELDVSELQPHKGGRYRQMIQEKQAQKSNDNGNIGLAIAVAMLVLVIGMGVYDNRDNLFQKGDSIEANVMPEKISTEAGILIEEVNNTEVSVELLQDNKDESTETVMDIIPVEVISGEKRQE